MAITYANYHQASGTAEELVLDFGLHSGTHTDAGPEPIHLTQRLVLSWPTAKRLLHTLTLLVQHHEAGHGSVTIHPRTPVAANGSTPSGPGTSPPSPAG